MADDLLPALPGMAGSLIQIGSGDRPTRIRVDRDRPVAAAIADVGPPLIGSLEIETDRFAFVLPLHHDRPTRWNGVDVRAGQVVVSPPGGQQLARIPASTSFGIFTVPSEMVQRIVHDLEPLSKGPDPNVVSVDRSSPLVERFRRSMRSERPLSLDEDACAEFLAQVVARATRSRTPAVRPSRAASSRSITWAVFQMLQAAPRWRPSIPELCHQIGVSERRLQLAFRDIFEITPSEFCHAHALSATRSELLRATPRSSEVTLIAHDHGFHHLGRFAGSYRATFGESPSATLRSQPA